jgi:hypothetical protein
MVPRAQGAVHTCCRCFNKVKHHLYTFPSFSPLQKCDLSGTSAPKMSKGEREEANLLSESDDYRDDDHITSQQDFHSKDGDHYEDGRPSSEVAERDYNILDEEDDRERLLARGGGSGGFPLLFNGGDTSGDKVKIGSQRAHVRTGRGRSTFRVRVVKKFFGIRPAETESCLGAENCEYFRHSNVVTAKVQATVTSGPHVEAYHHTHHHRHSLHQYSGCSISGFQTLPQQQNSE